MTNTTTQEARTIARREQAAFESKFAARDADAWFDAAIGRLRSTIGELARYRGRAQQHAAAGELAQAADNVSWALNSVSWLTPNMDLTAAARAEARLRVAAVLSREDSQ